MNTFAEMANPDLPEEILVEIFSRIPTKSVGKCRTLSKYWNTHLSASNFIKKHLISRQQTIEQEHLVLITEKVKFRVITSPTKNDEIFDDKSFRDEYFIVLGSCNGLILVDNFGVEKVSLMLMNPITRKNVIIQENCHKSFDYGFGYDYCSDDYKIVRISSLENGGRFGSTLVDVYSVKNGVWIRVDSYPYGGSIPLRYGYEGGAFVNGALHWLIGGGQDLLGGRGYRSCITAFDLANEVFREIPLPKKFVRQLGNNVEDYYMHSSCGVSIVGGCLGIVDNYGLGVTDIWIMTAYGVEDSWVKFCIEAGDGKWHAIVATLSYVEDGELLCLTSRYHLFACNLKGGTVRKVELGGRNDLFAHGIAFVDSLVSPGGSS